MINRGEIGSTLTWIVATVIIFIIVLIFMLLTGVLGFRDVGREISPLKFPEQQESLYAIYKNPRIREGIESWDSGDVESRVKPVLERIKYGGRGWGGIRGWNLFIFKGEEKMKIKTKEIPGWKAVQNFYYTKDSIKLRLYLESDTGFDMD
jgi:type IV secretory pathway VirB6-like protein